MSTRRTEHRYYKRPDWQTKADVTVILKRPHASQMRRLSREQRKALSDFIDQAQESFNKFKRALKQIAKPNKLQPQCPSTKTSSISVKDSDSHNDKQQYSSQSMPAN